MADRYWVGGAGTWDASTTTNWATSSGGAGGASAPTSADNAIFDAASDAGVGYTVTLGSTAVCNDLTMSGLDVATVLGITTTTALSIHGSMTLPATNLTVTSGAQNGNSITFRATTTGKTITTNGVSMQGVMVILDGVGGGWTLGSAFTGTASAGAGITVTNGTFSTSASNYNMTVNGIASDNSNTRTISFNASTITLIGTSAAGPVLDFAVITNLTFNAGTSQITLSGANALFDSGTLTFHNVSFTSTASGQSTFRATGTPTFNNLTFSAPGADAVLRFIQLGKDIIVSGALTITAGANATRRHFLRSDIIGTERTITCNGTLAALGDVDFRDIKAAGTVARPWTGTRLGDCKGNTDITFGAGVDKYWNLVAGGVWSATAWALTSGGAVAQNNFPLAQDKAIIENTGLNTSATITLASWNIGEWNLSTRTNAMNLTFGNADPVVYKDLVLSSAVTFTTVTGSPTITFAGRTTQNVTSAGVNVKLQVFLVNSPGGTVKLLDDLTVDLASGSLLPGQVRVDAGTLDLNDFDITCWEFLSNNANTRVLDFGTGVFNLIGFNDTIWSATTLTNFSYLGTPTVNSTYAGATGTRLLAHGNSITGTENNALDFNFTGGTDTITLNATFFGRNVNFTGFSGTLSSTARAFCGNLTISSGMTIDEGSSATTTFFGTSGTKTITTNGKLFNFPTTFDGIGGTFEMADALTVGSTKLLTLSAGTIKFKNGTTNSAGNIAIDGTSTNQVIIQSTSPGSTYTLTATSGPVFAYYATITDCIASPITTNTQLLGNIGFSGKSANVSDQDIGSEGISFKPDGIKMIFLGTVTDSLYEYTLSKPWNIDTASYTNVSFSVAAQDGNMQTIFFKPEGTRFFASGGDNDAVYEYDLSNAWDILTVTYNNVSFSVSAQTLGAQALGFKPDGREMYILDQVGRSVLQYSLGTEWSLATATYNGLSFNVSSQITTGEGLCFTSDGTKMIIADNATDAFYQYSLSTPWSIISSTYDNLSFYVGAQGLDLRNLFLKEGGDYSNYILYNPNSTAPDRINQFNFGSKFNAFTGAGNIYSHGNVNGGNNRGINFTPLGTQAIPFF